jgi:hypothetical protein
MTAAHLTFGPIRDTDIKLDPELEAKLRPRVKRISLEEFEKMRRTVIFQTRTT